MGFKPEQQYKINILLGTEFKKQYDLIPEEYKKNYFFQIFLYKLAEMKFDSDTYESNGMDNINYNFEYNSNDERMITCIDCSVYFPNDSLRKIGINVILDKNGELSFLYEHRSTPDSKDLTKGNSLIKELELKLSEDKSKVFVNYYITDKQKNYFININKKLNEEIKNIQLSMQSIFDIEGNELERNAQSVDLRNNSLIYEEEIISAELDTDKKGYYLEKFYNGEIFLDDDQDLYLVKSTGDGETKYAVFCKLKKYVNKAYERSFQPTSKFNEEEKNISDTLFKNSNRYVVEISEEDYNELIKEKLKAKIKSLK